MSGASTDRVIYAKGRTFAEHLAWLDSLVGDEYRIVHLPTGHLQNLAYVSYFKRALVKFELPADLQLKILEHIHLCVDGPVTVAAVSAIEPCCAIGAEMLDELNKAPQGEISRVFRDADMFRVLAKLNPSLLAALRLCSLNDTVPEQPRHREGRSPQQVYLS